MAENDPPKRLELSPRPWGIHCTGSHIGIKDAAGKFVIRKTVNTLSLEQYEQLSANLKHTVTCVNRADLAPPDAAAAEIESEKQFHFWLNNHWPDWEKSENRQTIAELMRDAWSAALRLARFDTLAHKGALNYIVELEKSQALTYRMARHIRNTDEVPMTRWGVDGMNLLAELRDLNPEQYDAEVKGPIRPYAYCYP